MHVIEKDATTFIMNTQYIYTYKYREEEADLCYLEMRSLFGKHSETGVLTSDICQHPDRSPFMHEKLEVIYEGESLEEIYEQVAQIVMGDKTFKVIFMKMNDLSAADKIEYDEQRQIERVIGMIIEGNADVRKPDQIFGLITLGGRWYFGNYIKSKAIWLVHMKKPKSYSIALSTRVARAIANIAVPHVAGVRAIDPCCGIGTVLVEALSMDIDIIGRDINHFVVQGTRENLIHFNYESTVTCGDIAEVTEHYDVAIIDLPYNHFSHTTPEAQAALILHARRIANKAVIVTVGDIDELLTDVGFTIIDRCTTRKSNFIRQIIVCQ